MDDIQHFADITNLKWKELNAFSKSIDRLDGALVRIRTSHDDNVTSSNGKVQKLTRRENLLADGLIGVFIDKWNSKNRECRTVKQALKTTANDRARLRDKCNDLEDHVTRLQRQFSQAIDLSVDEIQALSSCNNSFKSKIQILEGNCSRSEQSVTETVTRNINYLKTLKGKVTSNDCGTLTDEISTEINNLQRVLALNKEFQPSQNGINSHSGNSQTQLNDERNATQLIIKNELKDARDLLEKQKKYIKELEDNLEDSSEFAIESVLEDRKDESDIFQHLKQSILVQLQQGDNSSAYDDCQMSDDVSQEIENAKKIAETIRSNLNNIKKEIVKKEDEILDLKNSISETDAKFKNSIATANALSEERDFIKTKSQQLENRLSVAQDELQGSQNRIREAEHELNALKNEIILLRDGKEDYKSYCDKLSGQQDLLMDEVAKLKQDKDTTHKEKTAETNVKEQLRTENEYLNDEITALKLAARKFEQKKECYEEEIDRLLTENDELKLTGQGTDDEKRKQKEKVRELTIIIKDLEDQAYQSSNENKRLEGEIRRISKQHKQIEKQLEESLADYNDLSVVRDKLEEQLKCSRLGESKEVELSQEIQTKLKQATDETKEKDDKLNSANQIIARFILEVSESLGVSLSDVKGDKKSTTLQQLSNILPAVRELNKISKDHGRLILQIKSVIPGVEKDLASLDLLRCVTDLVTRSETSEKSLDRMSEKFKADCSMKDDECIILEQKLKERSNELKNRKNSENTLQSKIGYLRQQIKRNGSRFRRYSQQLTNENTKLMQELHSERQKCDDGVVKSLEDIHFNLDLLNDNLPKTDYTEQKKSYKGEDLMMTIKLNSEDVCQRAIAAMKDLKNQSKDHKEQIIAEEKEKEKYRMRVDDMKLLIEASEKKFSTLDRKIDTVKKFSTAVNQKMEIIHDGLSCVTMCNKEENDAETIDNTCIEQSDGADDMLSVVRETYKSNRKSFQAAVQVLESIKATYEVEDFDIEASGLNEGSDEEAAIGPLLNDLNSNINILLKDTRSFLASPSFQHLQQESMKETQQRKQQQQHVSDRCVEHKKQIARLLGELKEKDTKLRSMIALKDKLAVEAIEKDGRIEKLVGEQNNQTTAVIQLEKDLELLKIEYHHISKNLSEKEATLADMRDCILNEIVEQRKSKQEHHESQIVSRQEKNVDMKRIKASLDEIKTVNDGYSVKIEDLHEKVENFLKVFLENSTGERTPEKKKKAELRKSKTSSISELQQRQGKERTREDSAFETESAADSENQLRILLNTKEQENSYLQVVVREMKNEISNLQEGILPASEHVVNSNMIRHMQPNGDYIDPMRPPMSITNHDPHINGDYQHVILNDGSYAYETHPLPLNRSVVNGVSIDEAQSHYGYSCAPHQSDYYPQQQPLQQMTVPYNYRPEQDTPDDGCYMTCTMSESSVLPYSDDECPYCETCEESDPYFYSEEEWDQPYMSLADCSNVNSRQAKRISLLDGINSPTSTLGTSPMIAGGKHLLSTVDKSSERSFPICSTPSIMSSRGNDSDFEPLSENIDTNQFPYNFGDRSNPSSPSKEKTSEDSNYKKKKNRKNPRRLSIPFPFVSRKSKAK